TGLASSRVCAVARSSVRSGISVESQSWHAIKLRRSDIVHRLTVCLETPQPVQGTPLPAALGEGIWLEVCVLHPTVCSVLLVRPATRRCAFSLRRSLAIIGNTSGAAQFSFGGPHLLRHTPAYGKSHSNTQIS